MSHGGRREALQSAAEVFFAQHHVSEVDQKYFTKLMAHLGAAATRRNEIAHGTAIGLTVNDKNLGFVLVPPEYNSRKTTAFFPEHMVSDFDHLKADYRYTSADVRHFRLLQSNLVPAVIAYWSHIAQTYRRAG